MKYPISSFRVPLAVLLLGISCSLPSGWAGAAVGTQGGSCTLRMTASTLIPFGVSWTTESASYAGLNRTQCVSLGNSKLHTPLRCPSVTHSDLQGEAPTIPCSVRRVRWVFEGEAGREKGVIRARSLVRSSAPDGADESE